MRFLALLFILSFIRSLSCLKIYAHLICHGGHFTAMSSLVSRLSKRHSVTVVTTSKCSNKVQILKNDPNITLHADDISKETLDVNGLIELFWKVSSFIINENELTLEQTLGYLEKTKFDLLLTDSVMECNLIAAEVHNLPAISLISGHQGPTENFQDSTNCSAWKAFLLLDHHISAPFFAWRDKKREKLGLEELGIQSVEHSEYGGLFPMIINASPAFYPPVHPSLEHIYTGAHRNIDILDKIDGELLEWINAESSDIIFISMGTFAYIEPPIVKRFVEEVQQQSQRFIWAYGSKLGHVFEQVGVKRTEKIFVGKYLPQIDILMHEKVKAFVSHGGLHSSLDAVITKVPVICNAIIADQLYNCHKLAQLGAAVQVSNLDFLEIMTAYKDIQENYPSFKEQLEILKTNFSGYEKDDDLFDFVEKIASRKEVTRLREYPFQYNSWWFMPLYRTVYYGLWALCALLVYILYWFARMIIRTIYASNNEQDKKKM